MVTNIAKRPPGRPKGFIPDEALDRAVEMFWEHGFEGVDVDRIARAVNVTKPALYRAFGDKSTLLLRAVERYALIYGAPKMAAFEAEPDIHKAVTGFCEATVNTATGDARGGDQDAGLHAPGAGSGCAGQRSVRPRRARQARSADRFPTAQYRDGPR